MTEDKRGLDDFVVGGGSVEQILAACRPADDVLKEWSQNESARPKHDFTQWGAAQRLEDVLSGKFVWCPKIRWHGYDEDEGVWVRPAEYLLLRDAVTGLKDKTEEELRALSDLGSEKAVEMARKFSLDMQNVGNVKGAMKFLEPLMVGSWEQFDQDPNKLTVANGTLVFDGRDVRLEDHDPHDYITKKSKVTYDPAASAPFWEETLEAFVPNERIRSFLQRLAGSLLVAVGVKEQKIPFFWGEGGCGKSTFAAGMTSILGEELAVPIEPATIQAATRSGASASPDVMALLGARLVIAEEAEDSGEKNGTGIDVGMIKRWSGGTTRISARPLYGDQIKFMPTFTLVLIANSAPDFKDRTDGIWRRVVVIPMNTPMPESRKMEATEVSRRLKEQAPGILNWAIEGYREWRRLGGLNPPEEVLVAGRELRKSQDWLANFISECTHEDPDGFLFSDDLHKAFTDWRGGDKDIPDHSQRRLSAELKQKWGETKTKRRGDASPRGWAGRALGAQPDVAQVADVAQLSDNIATCITAGQVPFSSECSDVAQDSKEVRVEEEVTTQSGEELSEKLRYIATSGQKQPLTCGNDVAQLPLQVTLHGLPETHSFTGDDTWRRLYRRPAA